MGWDVDIVVNTGNQDHFVEDIGGMTYNVSSMYYKAFSLKAGFTGLHNMNCSAAVPYLKEAINNMENNSKEYRKLNPENDWGDYDGALNFLRKIKKYCTHHPLAKIRIY